MEQAQQQSSRLVGSKEAYADRRYCVLVAFSELTKAVLDLFPNAEETPFRKLKGEKEPDSTILSFAK